MTQRGLKEWESEGDQKGNVWKVLQHLKIQLPDSPSKIEERNAKHGFQTAVAYFHIRNTDADFGTKATFVLLDPLQSSKLSKNCSVTPLITFLIGMISEKGYWI